MAEVQIIVFCEDQEVCFRIDAAGSLHPGPIEWVGDLTADVPPEEGGFLLGQERSDISEELLGIFLVGSEVPIPRLSGRGILVVWSEGVTIT